MKEQALQVRNVARLVKGKNLAMTTADDFGSQDKPIDDKTACGRPVSKRDDGSPPPIRFTVIGRPRTAASSSPSISVLTRNRFRNGSTTSTFSIIPSLFEMTCRKRVPSPKTTSESSGRSQSSSAPTLGSGAQDRRARREDDHQPRAPSAFADQSADQLQECLVFRTVRAGTRNRPISVSHVRPVFGSCFHHGHSSLRVANEPPDIAIRTFVEAMLMDPAAPAASSLAVRLFGGRPVLVARHALDVRRVLLLNGRILLVHRRSDSFTRLHGRAVFVAGAPAIPAPEF